MTRPTRLPMLAASLLLLAAPTLAVAQGAPVPRERAVLLLGGLSQPLVFRGGNVEAQWIGRRFVAEYSHGWNLNIGEVSRTERDEGEDLDVRMRWTTGGGVGIRVTNRLSATVDVKAHRVALRHPDGDRATYTTYTLGPALNYTIPIWRGLVLQPVVRWWPRVGSSEEGDRVALRRGDGSTYVHEAIDQGPGGFNANVKLGWRF